MIPVDFDYKETRELFLHPNISSSYPEFKVTECKTEELRKFLVEEKSFDVQRVSSILNRLEKS